MSVFFGGEISTVIESKRSSEQPKGLDRLQENYCSNQKMPSYAILQGTSCHNHHFLWVLMCGYLLVLRSVCIAMYIYI